MYSAQDCCMMCNWDRRADTPHLDWCTSLSDNRQCNIRWPNWIQFYTINIDCMMNSWNNSNCNQHIICLYPIWHKFPQGKLSNIAQELWLFLLLQLLRYFASKGTYCYDIFSMNLAHIFGNLMSNDLNNLHRWFPVSCCSIFRGWVQDCQDIGGNTNPDRNDTQVCRNSKIGMKNNIDIQIDKVSTIFAQELINR